MPLPQRYAAQVPDLVALWAPAGYFAAQTRIWAAQCRAAHELTGAPTAAELGRIEAALTLAPTDVQALTAASGHETNKLLRLVQSRLGPEGNYVHRGNTSSDVLDTSLALQMLGSLDVVAVDLAKVAATLRALALQHRLTLQVARSHGIHAIPHTFGRKVAGWLAEALRGQERLERCRQVIGVGKLAGEVGTHVFIQPALEERALALLGLRPDPAPTQVIPRDRHAEVVMQLALVGGMCARVALNVRLMAQTEVGEVREPFGADQQGSSAMPHKMNPELSERIRGLVALMRGNVVTAMECMDLWHERDMSHSSAERTTLPDSFGNLCYALRLLHTHVLSQLVVFEQVMAANVERTNGALYSSRLLNELLETGQVDRTTAYDQVKALAQQALKGGPHLRELAAQDALISALLPPDRLAELFDPAYYLRNIGVAYQRLGLA